MDQHDKEHYRIGAALLLFLILFQLLMSFPIPLPPLSESPFPDLLVDIVEMLLTTLLVLAVSKCFRVRLLDGTYFRLRKVFLLPGLLLGGMLAITDATLFITSPTQALTTLTTHGGQMLHQMLDYRNIQFCLHPALLEELVWRAVFLATLVTLIGQRFRAVLFSGLRFGLWHLLDFNPHHSPDRAIWTGLRGGTAYGIGFLLSRLVAFF